MTHKEKEMINTNKAVIVNFAANASGAILSSTSSADIYIPFLVKQINLKGIDLDFDNDFSPMYFTSSLVDHSPLGSGFAGILCDFSNSSKNLSYIFNTPRDINGAYSFTYNILHTSAFYFQHGFVAGASAMVPNDINALIGSPAGRVLFMLEFIGYQ